MAQILSLPPLPTEEQLREEHLNKWEEILDTELELVQALMRMIEAKREIIREVRQKHQA
jgi:hypothetical protein